MLRGRREVSRNQRRVKPCLSYLPGHTVHYIQAREAWRHPEYRRAGMVRRIVGQAVEFQSDDGESLQLFSHDPEDVAWLIAELGSRAVYDPRWGLLRFEVPTGAMLVSVSEKPEIGPCSAKERGGTMTRPHEDETAEEFAARVYSALMDDRLDG